MELPGVDSILYRSPDSPKGIWRSEQQVPPEVVDLFKRAESALELERTNEVAELVVEIARHTLQPSQEMRLHYLHGRLFSEMQDYDQAYSFYEMALDLADDHNDLDSQILLTMLAGEVRYGKTRNREALLYFREALAMWRFRTRQLPSPPVETEVHILQYMGRVLWLIGEFDEAEWALARTVTLAFYRGNRRRSMVLQQAAAFALWTLMLSFRSQSDMLDGDSEYLHAALRRARSSVKLFESIGTHSVNMARLYIQIAEIHLDLAELHLQRGATAAFRSARRQALSYITSTTELQHLTTDVWGKRLTEMTLLRYDIQSHSPREAIRTLPEVESRFIAIERAAADGKEQTISAKAATLRAEWLMQFKDKDATRAALLLAFKGFHGNGVGMATRAHRLLRRLMALNE